MESFYGYTDVCIPEAESCFEYYKLNNSYKERTDNPYWQFCMFALKRMIQRANLGYKYSFLLVLILTNKEC